MSSLRPIQFKARSLNANMSHVKDCLNMFTFNFDIIALVKPNIARHISVSYFVWTENIVEGEKWHCT